jgi:hypothetical protein
MIVATPKPSGPDLGPEMVTVSSSWKLTVKERKENRIFSAEAAPTGFHYLHGQFLILLFLE